MANPAEWSIAPGEHLINNYDKYKLRYRRLVEDYIKTKPLKVLKKQAFFTISTNVLCAIPRTKFNKETNFEPLDVDHYLPLEISITKWSLQDAKTKTKERSLKTKVWLLDPGPPPITNRSDCMKHSEKHKIQLDHDCSPSHKFIESDYTKVMKEINGFLNSERLVFSTELRHVRQDLGCLKWLAINSGIAHVKPIEVCDLVNLYVVLFRTLNEELVGVICQSIARFQMDKIQNDYEMQFYCDYHRSLAETNEENSECRYCASCKSIGWTNQLLDDVVEFTDIFEDFKTVVEDSPKKVPKPHELNPNILYIGLGREAISADISSQLSNLKI